MKIGYVRVSTEQQNEQRQINALNDLGVEKLYIDKASGKDTERKTFKEMMAFCREGDVIYTESISRISRNTKDLLNIIDTLKNKKVGFISLKESFIDTTTPQGTLVLQIFAALAEFEREQSRQRQLEGIEIAKQAGKYKGRRRIEPPKDFERIVQEWRVGKITAVKARRLLGLKPNTFYRRVAEYESRIKPKPPD